MQHRANKGLAGRLWEKTREHASNAVVGGAILVLTGFTPEHWVAEVLHRLRLSGVASFWPWFIDGRLFVLTLGVAVIVGDLLWRRHRAVPTVTSSTPISSRNIQAPSLPVSHSDEPALPDKPSIAVLPFQNMSGDADQEHFAEGVVEEITISLSRLRWLFVIAHNSSFTYKGRPVDVKQVGRELGVRYVLEGSVRK